MMDQSPAAQLAAVRWQFQEIAMSKIDSTRIYYRNPSGSDARLFWVRNNRPNEMLLGIYGLDGKPASMKYVFPELEFETDSPPPLDFKYADASEMDIPIDHFTCHSDGRFHVKTHGDEDLYTHKEKRGEALGPDSPPFLDLLVLTDVLSKCSHIYRAKIP